MTLRYLAPLCLAIFSLLCTISRSQDVKIESRPLVLPTYEIGEAEKNPIFFTGRVYQGAQGHIYPYPLYDVLTDDRVDKEYEGVYLENEYVELCVLPEIGGRILSATDKTNGYEFFYRQHVVKPALIGMLGAWMSGGVEWNIPHHHRPSSFMPINHRKVEKPDGSCTVWIGETELRHRMKWSVGLTLHPNSSLVEAKVVIMNRTPLIQSLLYWANVSVHCDEHYQVIFPPGTQFGTGHSKTSFVRWPINDGKDISWWKNYTSGSESVFAWDFDNDFFAGYDHGKHAGTMHTANHHIVGGKKFFLWGNNPSAEMWDKMLTDDDGPYLELMVGAFSDNQPDYSWIGPGEVREFEQYWYPIREIRSVKNANKQAAVNLEMLSPTKVFLGFNTTSPHENVIARLSIAGNLVWENTIDIAPDKPFVQEIDLPNDVVETQLRVCLVTADGKELVAYQPVEYPVIDELPTPVEGTKPAAECETIEELYLTGLRLEQFHNARIDPMIYYNEALKRDPNDARVNTAVGIRLAREARWDESETHLRRAVERLSKNYTTPRDSEPNYYLGYVLHQQGKLKEAKDRYWKATWLTTCQSAAYFALAQIACTENDFPAALKLIDSSLNTNVRNTKALTVKAYILRKLDRKDEAMAVLQSAIEIDPLDLWSFAEMGALCHNVKDFDNGMIWETWNLFDKASLRLADGFIRPQEAFETAIDYMHVGAFREARAVLNLRLGDNVTTKSEMAVVYSDYLLHKEKQIVEPNGDHGRLIGSFLVNSLKPSDYSFPFRTEEIPMLEMFVESTDSSSPNGHYYLGNLLYYLNQKERAIDCWEKAVTGRITENSASVIALTLRNLGFAYAQAGEWDKAVAVYEKAVNLELVSPRLLVELDRLYEQTGKPVAERLAIYDRYVETVMRHDDAVIRLLGMYNQSGRFEQAIDILATRHFHVWEGGGEVHRYFVDAHLLDGLRKFNAGRYADAVRAFETADTYPANLEVGRPADGGHSPKVFYLLGKAYQKQGNAEKAAECFRIAGESGRRGGASELTFFRGMALRELGDTESAADAIHRLAENVDRQLNSPALIDEYSKFGEDGSRSERLAQLQYLNGLVHLARGEHEKAASNFETAVRANPDLIWGKVFLEHGERLFVMPDDGTLKSW